MSFENWDLLSPQEQARRLSEHVGQTAVPQIQALQQQMAQTLAQKDRLFMNYVSVLREAFNRKIQNPDLDLQKFMQTAVEHQQGFNPLESAYTAVTAEATQKKRDQETYERAKADIEQQRFNPPQETPIHKREPLSRAQVKEAARSQAVEKGIDWNDTGAGYALPQKRE